MMPAGLDAISAAVLSWLLTYAIHSTILLTGAAVVAWRLSDRHALLDLIWKTALIAPLVTASVHLGPVAIPFDNQWRLSTLTTGAPDQARSPSVEPSTERVATAEATPSEEVQQRAATRATRVDEAPGEPASRASVNPAWPSIAVAAWLLIAGAGLVRYVIRLVRVYRIVGNGRPVAAPDLLRAVDVLRDAAGERQSIALMTSEHCAVPLALANRRVVVPERFVEQLGAEQQQAALAHEIAHIARRDPAWRIAAGLIERALFFQPLNRVARAKIGESAEFLCDAWAVQHTPSPLALARCLSAVASWASPATDEWAVGASAMARSDSAMVRRVAQILDETSRVTRRPRAIWMAIPLACVVIVAPRVTAAQLPAAAPVAPAVAAILNTSTPAHGGSSGQDRSQQVWTAAEIARAQSDLRVYRPARPGDSLEDRWRWALAESRRLRVSDFWIAYSFETPVHDGDFVMSDSGGNSFVTSNGRLDVPGPALMHVLGDGGGNVVALFHYRGSQDDAVDRAGYRSAGLGFDFERAPLFWLGLADEAQSFARVRGLFERTRAEEVRHLLIDLASIHGNSNVVIPFLTELVALSQPSGIRSEAAEGFGNHHDARSVEVLLRVARTDPVSDVRSEAAETIGEVQTPQSIPALTALVTEAGDPEVRREAAEAFGEQPAQQAVPAIERVLANVTDEDVLAEAVEALGDLEGAGVLGVLVETARTHPSRRVQLEAVETMGDIDDAGALDALTRIVWEHDHEEIQREAVETLGDRHEDGGLMAALERILGEHPREGVQAEAIETLMDNSKESLPPQVLAVAASGKTAGIRREAIDAIGDAVSESGDARLLDRVEQLLERAIFDDPDTSVRMEALDTLEKLPRDREQRILRRVIDGHPDSRVRREAQDHLRERQ